MSHSLRNPRWLPFSLALLEDFSSASYRKRRKASGHLSILLGVLRDLSVVACLDLRGWDLLVRQARSADLLARLCSLLDESDHLSSVPERARRHLDVARVVAERHVSAVRWEVRCIERALRSVGASVVLLKGAAYLIAHLPPARGRVFYDVDIMVPKETLQDVERDLLLQGWAHTISNSYDQEYFRKWMHELPPLRHSKRRTVLDVHHTILPETARSHPDPRKLLADVRPLEGYNHLYVLGPVSMVLHSITHLFHEGEFEHGLRDVTDLDDLLRHFSKEEGFWDKLLRAAEEHELERTLFYGLHYSSLLLGTPVPAQVLDAARKRAGLSDSMLVWMDSLYTRALAPDHATCRDRFTGTARWLLYVRAHYLRMPLSTLIPHLVRKAMRRAVERDNRTMGP